MKMSQASSFENLLILVWEGGQAYDLKIEPNNLPAHNACHLVKALFPQTWDAREKHLHGWRLNFGDGSTAFVAEDGGEVSSVAFEKA